MVSTVQFPNWRVLVIEDDPLAQLGIEQVLADYPALTLIGTVNNGYLGVEATHRDKPDLVLMDIGLPGIDGIEATQQIKGMHPTTKVVILTSHMNKTEVLAAFASGADAYCIKGGSLDILVTAIATVAQNGVYLDAQIANIIIQNFQPTTPEAPTSSLSNREYEVLELLVEGLSNPEIAKRLYISPNTVRGHMRSLMTKLSANDRVHVAVKALRAGLI